MRVGLIAPPWLPVPPPKYGGTEAVIDNLARGLSDRGHDVVLFCTGDSTCPVPRRWVFEHAERDNLGQVVSEVRHVIAAYDAVADCDVVHDHSIVGPLYAQRFPWLPLVTTAHGPFSSGLDDFYRAIAARTPIIAISRHQASTAGATPVAAVIHHGVEPDMFPFGAGDGGYYCWLGRMTPYKGARIAALVARRAGVRLVMAAKMQHGDEVAYFHEAVEPLLGGDVEYVGEVTARERNRLLAGAIALINPITWDEPFGLVMIEAFACGTPVVAFARGAAPEIVDDGVTGLLCRDADEMTARLPDVARIDRAACRKIVEAHFSTGRMVAEHLDLYAQLVRDGREGLTAPAAPCG